MSDQNRPPPAFQEFAASMMARTDYRLLNLAQRGLLYALRLECWVNHRMPADPAKLARVLGLDAAEVAAALPSLEAFFDVADGDLTCPELDDYRAHLDERRARQSEGGKRGAARTNADRKPAPRKALKVAASTPTGKPQVACESSVQQSTAQPSTAQQRPALQKKDYPPEVDREFVEAYDTESNGGCPF